MAPIPGVFSEQQMSFLNLENYCHLTFKMLMLLMFFSVGCHLREVGDKL